MTFSLYFWALVLATSTVRIHGYQVAIDTSNAAWCTTEFQRFKLRFGRVYATSEEDQYRQHVFCHNVVDITERNRRAISRGHDTRFGVNQFADLTAHEFERMYLTYRPSVQKMARAASNLEARLNLANQHHDEDRFDWRDRKAVTAVKDQGKK